MHSRRPHAADPHYTQMYPWPGSVGSRQVELRRSCRRLLAAGATAVAFLSGSTATARVAVATPRLSQDTHVGLGARQRAERPIMTVHGYTLRWHSIPGAERYVLAGAVSNHRLSSQIVRATRITPRIRPGTAVSYRVRALTLAPASPWSNVVTIRYARRSPGKSLGAPQVAKESSFMVGINPGGGSCCGTSVDSGMMSAGIGYARVDPSGGMGPASDFVGVGMKVDLNISGDCSGSSPTGYSSGSVSAINAAGWATCAVAVWKNVCQASTVKCPSLEELNEPGGSWFWGGNANTQAAADNYVLLIEDTWNAFHSAYGASCDSQGTCPLLLASFDGGDETGNEHWGQKVFANSSGIPVNNYLNGWTDHPYGDDSNAQGGCDGEGTGLSAAAADNYDISMSNVTTTHSVVGSKPIYLTEVGWQTGRGECSGQQQADNLYGLFQWAKSAGYIGGILVFNYSDFSGDAFGMVGNTQAGNETIQGQKPAWTALKEAAANQPCTAC